AAALAGDAIWIVDDLVDLYIDWEAGTWSRPLWVRARRDPGAEPPASAVAAIEELLETGVVGAEARRLSGRLAALARHLGARPDPAFHRIILATVHSWLDGVPG